MSVMGFTRKDVPSRLRHYLASGAELLFPSQGMTSEVAIAGAIVLKRCRNPIYLSWLARERQVLTLLAQTGLPIPALLDSADVDGEGGRESWLVMSRREGRDLRGEIQNAGLQRRVELYRGAGELHGYLALDNVLVDATGSMSLIDWSGGDAGDPRFDVSLALRTETTAVSAREVAAFAVRLLLRIVTLRSLRSLRLCSL